MNRRTVIACVSAATAAILAVNTPAAFAEPATSESVTPTTSSTTDEPAPTTSETPTTSAEPSTTATTETGAETTEASPTSSASATTPKPRSRAGVTTLAASGLSVSTGGYGTIVPGASSAGGSLPLVTVASGGGGAWTATASSNGFSCPAMTIPASAVTYSATAPAGGLYMYPKSNQNLGSPQVVMTSTSGLAELVTWTPLLSVSYPAGAAICTFSGTITVSVA